MCKCFIYNRFYTNTKQKLVQIEKSNAHIQTVQCVHRTRSLGTHFNCASRVSCATGCLAQPAAFLGLRIQCDKRWHCLGLRPVSVVRWGSFRVGAARDGPRCRTTEIIHRDTLCCCARSMKVSSSKVTERRPMCVALKSPPWSRQARSTWGRRDPSDSCAWALREVWCTGVASWCARAAM